MRLVGLTGGIGSGKSSVSRLLDGYGARIIDADRITHSLERRGEPVWREIWERFGWPVLLSDGTLDRKKLGHIVFNDEQCRQQLNAIVHPAVQREIRSQVEESRKRGDRVTILDVPLLIEGGLYRMVDEVWVVYAEPEQQMDRIRNRDGVSAETAWQRIGAQMPLRDKLPFAQQVIDNRGTESALEEVVQKLWQNVLRTG